MRYHLPTQIYFGTGIFSQLKTILSQEVKAEKVFLVTDPGIKQAGIVDQAVSYLPKAEVFDAIEQNPKHSTVNQAGEQIRRHCSELVIGLGGGSVLDAAKAIALLATNPGNIEDYEGREKYQAAPLQVVAIPTTCGTGSEVTWVAVITHTERHFKMSIKGPEMYPAVALVDPDLLKSLPAALVASTGMDALVHAIEAYTVKPATFITDIFALEAIRLIHSSLERAYIDIVEDDDARENLMKGSLVAGMAFGNSDVGAVHCISESIGAILDMPHGVANAIFLPYVMEFNLLVAYKRYADIARIFGISIPGDKEAAAELIKEIQQLSQNLGIPSFRDTGVKESQLPEIAAKSFDNNSNPSNPREATSDDYLSILQIAFNA